MHDIKNRMHTLIHGSMEISDTFDYCVRDWSSLWSRFTMLPIWQLIIYCTCKNVEHGKAHLPFVSRCQ